MFGSRPRFNHQPCKTLLPSSPGSVTPESRYFLTRGTLALRTRMNLRKRLAGFVALTCLAIGCNTAIGQTTSELLDPNLDRAVRATLLKRQDDLSAGDLLLLT